jgi:hypothetical protein
MRDFPRWVKARQRRLHLPTVRFASIVGILLRYREPLQWAMSGLSRCSRQNPYWLGSRDHIFRR